MAPKLQVRENFNEEVGHVVWSVERIDGTMLYPEQGIQSINYGRPDVAEIGRDRIERELANANA